MDQERSAILTNMPKLVLFNPANIKSAKSFLTRSQPFVGDGQEAELELDPKWIQVDPFSLSMVASWGAWCRRLSKRVRVKNIGKHANYLARMKLFQQLDNDYNPPIIEHEQSGRFLPLTQVRNHQELRAVIADISALLHLDNEPDALAAVQYCVSELIRNALEHSGSPEGAFVCAHRYVGTKPERVTIAVSDCGRGIAEHLGQAYPEATESNKVALGLAMRPGITGAVKAMYGTPENAGAGLFITRSIAKGTGGYFLLVSGDAAYRLMRSTSAGEEINHSWMPTMNPGTTLGTCLLTG